MNVESSMDGTVAHLFKRKREREKEGRKARKKERKKRKKERINKQQAFAL